MKGIIILLLLSSCASSGAYKKGMIDGCSGMLWHENVVNMKEYSFQLIAKAHRDCLKKAKL